MLRVLVQSVALALILSSSSSHLVKSDFIVNTVLPKATSIFEAHKDKDIAITNDKHCVVHVANSNGYESYRQKVDIKHGYHILKSRGIKDERNIFLMYDDVANKYESSIKRTLFNHPCGLDVHNGVQKNYIGEAPMTKNLQAFILVNKKKVKGLNRKNKNKKAWLTMPQSNATIWYLKNQVKKYHEGSKEKAEAQKELNDELARRKQIDENILKISQILFGDKEGTQICIRKYQRRRQPLDDEEDSADEYDDCAESLMETYEIHCGHKRYYLTMYPDAFMNMCKEGVDKNRMAQAASQACKPALAPTHQ